MEPPEAVGRYLSRIRRVVITIHGIVGYLKRCYKQLRGSNARGAVKRLAASSVDKVGIHLDDSIHTVRDGSELNEPSDKSPSAHKVTGARPTCETEDDAVS